MNTLCPIPMVLYFVVFFKTRKIIKNQEINEIKMLKRAYAM